MASLDRPEPHMCVRARLWRMLIVLFLFLLFPFLAGACIKHPGGQGPISNELNAVVALAPDNVWAVGGISTSEHFGRQVLIEHWDGRRWQTATLPEMAGELFAISADSASDIWAVGGFPRGNPLLVLHWNGHHWQSLSTGMSLNQGVLLGVLALSPRNVWAVGTDGRRQALIEHWDGASWKSVPQPYKGLVSSLQAITGRAANDLWSVGKGDDYRAISEHWDGKSWEVVPMPRYAQDKRLLGDPDFPGVAALPDGQLWAVGEIDLSSVYQSTPLIERWNGKQWQVVYGSAPQNPDLHTPGAMFQSVVALNAHNAWAVGSRGTTDAGKNGYVLVSHWDGQSWQPVKAPSFQSGSQFNSISALTANDIWSVGGTYTSLSGGGSVTLIEHWNGQSWQAVSGLNPGTPAPPTGMA